MTEQKANKLRKSFEESEIFQYYRRVGNKMATHNAETSLRMKYGGAIKANAIRKPGQRSEAGKKGGDANVKSGHWASLKTKEHQRKAGKKGGDANVKSGHWAKYSMLGTKAAAKLSAENVTKKYKIICDKLEKNIFSVTELQEHLITLGHPIAWSYNFLKFANVELVKKVNYNNKKTIYKKINC